MGGGRSGEDKSQTKRKLVGTKTCFMFPRWVLFYVAWVLVATKVKKKKKMLLFQRKEKTKMKKTKKKNIKEVFFQNLDIIDQQER